VCLQECAQRAALQRARVLQRFVVDQDNGRHIPAHIAHREVAEEPAVV
jgi:DNA-directed RNA polymerase subunit K/omega